MYHFDMPPKKSYVSVCHGRGRGGGRGGAPVLPPPYPAEGCGHGSDEGATKPVYNGSVIIGPGHPDYELGTKEKMPARLPVDDPDYVRLNADGIVIAAEDKPSPKGYSVRGSNNVVVGDNERVYREAARQELNVQAEPFVSKQIKTAYTKIRRIAAVIDVCDKYVFYETDRDKKVVQEMVVIVANALREACAGHALQTALEMLIQFGRIVGRRISRQFMMHDHYCQKSCQLVSDIQGVAFYLLHCVVFTKQNEFESYEHVIVSLRNCFSYVKDMCS